MWLLVDQRLRAPEVAMNLRKATVVFALFSVALPLFPDCGGSGEACLEPVAAGECLGREGDGSGGGGRSGGCCGCLGYWRDVGIHEGT